MHIKLLITLVALLIFLPSWCQDQREIDVLYEDLRAISSDEMKGRKTGTKGNRRARNYIIQRFKEIGLAAADGSYVKPFGQPETIGSSLKSGVNVVGYLPGRNKKCVIISAHYDHLGKDGSRIYNGSDDNASGVALLLYLAQQIKATETDHSMLFVAFDAEEQGLAGAHAFVEDPPVSPENIVLNINMDMMSRSDKNELFVSGTYYYPTFKEPIRAWREDYTINLRMGHDNPRNRKENWLNSSDHYAFHKRGIPFLYFGVEDHDDYHKPTDTFDKTNFKFYKEVARVMTDIVLKIDKLDLSNIKNQSSE